VELAVAVPGVRAAHQQDAAVVAAQDQMQVNDAAVSFRHGLFSRSAQAR
jgi:hypothetical protein